MTLGVLVFASSKLMRVFRHRTAEVCALSIDRFGLSTAKKPPGRMGARGLKGRIMWLKNPMLNIQVRSGRKDSWLWVKIYDFVLQARVIKSL